MLSLKHTVLHVTCQLFLSDFNESSFFPHILEKNPSFIKFRENPASVKRVFPRGQTDGGDETVVYRNFANALRHRISALCFCKYSELPNHSEVYEFLNSVQDKCCSPVRLAILQVVDANCTVSTCKSQHRPTS